MALGLNQKCMKEWLMYLPIYLKLWHPLRAYSAFRWQSRHVPTVYRAMKEFCKMLWAGALVVESVVFINICRPNEPLHGKCHISLHSSSKNTVELSENQLCKIFSQCSESSTGSCIFTPGHDQPIGSRLCAFDVVRLQ